MTEGYPLGDLLGLLCNDEPFPQRTGELVDPYGVFDALAGFPWEERDVDLRFPIDDWRRMTTKLLPHGHPCAYVGKESIEWIRGAAAFEESQDFNLCRSDTATFQQFGYAGFKGEIFDLTDRLLERVEGAPERVVYAGGRHPDLYEQARRSVLRAYAAALREAHRAGLWIALRPFRAGFELVRPGDYDAGEFDEDWRFLWAQDARKMIASMQGRGPGRPSKSSLKMVDAATRDLAVRNVVGYSLFDDLSRAAIHTLEMSDRSGRKYKKVDPEVRELIGYLEKRAVELKWSKASTKREK